MKNTLYFFVLFSIITSCSVKEKPIFIKVDNLKIISFTPDTIHLKGEAFFKNPNDVGGKIATDAIKVIVNETEVAEVSSDEFEVPAREDFIVPLKVMIPTKSIFKNNKNGILGGLLNSFLNKKITVQFKGDLKYTILGFSSTYPINKVQEIKL